MRIKRSIENRPLPICANITYVVIGLVLLLWSGLVLLASTGEEDREQKIKAAYLYNFVLLNKWPPEKLSANEGLLTIGVLGDGESFVHNIFEPISGEVIEGRRLIVKRIRDGKLTQELKRCHVLFIAPSVKKNIPQILKDIKGYHVLTVSDTPGFVEVGGMIQFVEVGSTIRFKINKTAIDKEKIWISSQVLRLATKIIEE